MSESPPATRWRLAERPPAAATLEAAGYSPLMAALLARRGVDSTAAAASFLTPSLAALHPPSALANLDRAVERLSTARAAGERVAIVGDYDVDGITASAILRAVFDACGLDSLAILPNRFTEGYGFRTVHVERAVAAGTALVLTADCGTRSHAAVDAALAAGLDVIVTDHHLPGTPLDPRAILINPRQQACAYPYPDLSGAGLAFKLALAFAASCGREVDPLLLLRVACLGTIADLVPLTGENRVIAALGLDSLGATRAPGLSALMQAAGVAAPLSAADVGFRLGPRLNAAGRMASADPALELLLERDPARAAELAALLERQNEERRACEARVVEEARERVLAAGELPPILVEWDAAWERGVLGIAAGRLAREFHRPAVLLSLDGDSAVGSGRSVPGIHLHDFLAPWQDELEGFGGHAQAIGLSAAAGRLEELRQAWRQGARAWDPKLLVASYVYDATLELAALTRELVAELARLEPHGVGNPRPVFRCGPLEAAAAPRTFGTGHGSLRVRDGGGVGRELVGWGWGERFQELPPAFEILARAGFDSYLGEPRLELVDLRPAAATDA